MVVKMKKKDIKIFIIVFSIYILVFSPLLKNNLISDDYFISNLGYIEYIKKYSLNDGRIFCAILPIIFNTLHIPILVGKSITLILGLMIGSITVIKLKKIIEKYKKPKGTMHEILLTIISMVTIYNFFLIDTLLFIDAPIIVTSILLNIIVADILVTKDKQYLLKSFVLLMIAAFSYQATITAFFAMVFLFSIIKNKNNIKKIMLDLIQATIILGLVVIINFTFIKLYGRINNIEGRIINSKNIVSNLITVLNCLDIMLITNFNFYYWGMFIGIIILLSAVTTIYGVKHNVKNSMLIKMICIILSFIICSSIMFVFVMSSFWSGRTRIPLAMTIGAIFIFLYEETQILEKEHFYKYILISILTFYLVTMILYYVKIINSKKQNDIINIQGTNAIIEYVNEYENKTGNKVKNIIELALADYPLEISDYRDILKNTPYSNNYLIELKTASGFINYYSNYKFSNCIYKTANEFGEPGSYYCKDDTLYIYICIW